MASPTDDVMFTVGEDITVRPYRPGDADDIARHANNYKIWVNLTDRFPHPYTVADAKQWIEIASGQDKWIPTLSTTSKMVDETDEDFKLRRQASRVPTALAICHHDKVIGSCGLDFEIEKFPRSADMGYWMSEEYWGRGIMTKVATALLQWGFDTFPWVVRIGGNAYSWNPASMNVLQKIGMQPEGILKLIAFKDGKYGDIHHFSKIREGFVPDIRK